MDESEDNLSSEDMKSPNSSLNAKTKPKKRSLIERELETSLTARITSPVTNADGTSTSRYGRARRLKSEMEPSDIKKVTTELKSPLSEKSPLHTQTQSPVYKMHASNSPIKRTESPIKIKEEKFLDDQIESIYQENISLSRFSSEEVNTATLSPAKKFPKVYIRKDLIQKREPEDTVMVIQNMFSPVKSSKKSTNTHLNNILERSSERYSLNTKQQNGYLDNSSVVKTLDFDGKKKKEIKDRKTVPSKSELFDLEAKCAFQVGDLAWARMGTYPFWPSIVTRDPANGIFVKKKLFGRIERDIIHVTFFGDNGRRGWIVDTMLRKYLGQLEFETARENFTPEAKKKDPRLYAAFFVSEKKQALWSASVEEAEMLFREPKRLRIDIFLDMLEKSRSTKAKQPKSKISRTDSDVSLSESLYDSLFSEDDGKTDNNERSRNRTRNKSLDMFEVVTACLDNMAAKTGITKIQRQSHMDRWLQKAKSKTPEKTKPKTQVPSKKLEIKKEPKVNGAKKKKSVSSKIPVQKSYSLRKSSESQSSQHNNSIDCQDVNVTDSDLIATETDSCKHSAEINGIGIIFKVESLAEKDSEKSEEIILNESTASESLKESSEDMNGTCDSETFTDDENHACSSVDKASNNKTKDKEISAEQGIEDLTNTDSKNKVESNLVSNTNEDLDIDNIIEERNSTNTKENIENLDSIHDKIESNDEFKKQDSATENVTGEVSPTLRVASSEKELETNTSESQESSDKEQTHKETSTEPDSNVNTQSTEIDESSIETVNVHQDTSNLTEVQKETIETRENKEDNTMDIETNEKASEIDENEAEMSIDDDSDSERLPYSPLSNLGNNSDDNLSLDDVPFAEEFDKQETATVNKLDLDELVDDVSETRHKNDKTDVSKIKIDISFNKTILQNGHIHEENTIRKCNEHKITEHKNNMKMPSDDTQRSTGSVNNNGYRGKNVRQIEMTAKEVSISAHRQLEQVNGFHDMNGDLDLETASVHSEDSEASSKSDRRKLHSKQMKNNPLENAEFVKYMELRQDAIMDEMPDLSETEIVAYLYKTWLYEENAKSDVKKNDDLRECNLVKGLTQVQKQPPTRSKKKLSLNKHQSSNKNIMQRFLRRKKNLEINETENDELCFFRKRGVRKNMIIDDDDDDDEVLEEEYRESPRNFIEKNITKDQNLSTGDLSESHVRTVKLIDIVKGKDEVNLGFKETQKPETESVSTGEPASSTANDAVSTKTGANREKCNEIPTEKSSSIRGTPTIEKDKIKDDFDADSLDSEDSEAPLIKCKLRSKAKKKENDFKESSLDRKIKDENLDTMSINSEDSEISVTKRKKRFGNKKVENALEDPEFVKYLEIRQDEIIDENPQLTQDEIVSYLYQTYLYEENTKSDIMKTDDIEQSTLVKGLKDVVQQPKKIRRKIPKTEKGEKETGDDDTLNKDKPKRKSVKPFYNEEYSDIEEELEVFEIFKPKNKVVPKLEPGLSVPDVEQLGPVEVYDEVELYFAELTKPKPNIFKGLVREKVCEICEKVGSLVKCKGCSGMFHVDCVKKQVEITDVPAPTRGRKKKKKAGRKPKNSEEFYDDKSQDTSEENNVSIEEILEADSHTVDADILEAQLSAKMKEILDTAENIEYDSYSSDDGHDWSETVPGKCEIIDVKLKPRQSISGIDYSDFKCNNCQKYTPPICFVCKGVVSKKESTKRQKCHVAHCHKFYHLECLDHWPQTQFNGGEPSKNNKKINEYFEALTCPRHVCHTCVSDDPRGCKTRFSGDKLARCVRCPATYHSFTKCLPAGTQILTASHIICPRHYEHRPGKVPCHVNTGWCFICALGGSLICCEYCPTSFHAECLNIDPPEGGYMCEDCETGRLPLYGEMVWVKLGHYRWWPGIILHPYEIPENLLAVKHSLGEFVVRFFGQYDHYWVNRGRVFPFQEGDSGRISSQKSKIDAAFTTAMEHAQRACEILKTARPNEEESIDIASSLLPPHYVKLKVNKPCGSLCGRKLEDPESSLTQCECNPLDEDPCGPYSQCLNRMLLTECGPTCRAGDRCNNRAFERRSYPKLVPYRTPSRGWGLKTLEDIKAGQFVIEYVGELIDEDEFKRRMRRKHEIRDENFYFLTLDKERMIDAGPKGNLARFMNHCCEPNCETQKWTVLGDVRVGLFTLFDIPAHSEVTFNYNLECAGIDKKRCMCGAKRCSGYIGAKPKQDESQTKKPKLHSGKRTYKKRKPEESPSTKNKPKRPLGRPPKPRELTEIEKDLLIIRNATNGLSSDESSRSLSSEFERNPKALKRKRVSFSTEEVVLDGTESPNVKKTKLDDRIEGE